MGEPSEALVLALLEAAPDAIIAMKRDGCIAVVNAQTVRMFGYERADLLGHSIELLVPERFRGRHPGHREAYLLDPRPRPMGAGTPLAARRRDGSEFPAEISLSSLESGEMIVAAVRDVSDRARREAKFRGLLEAAPDACVRRSTAPDPRSHGRAGTPRAVSRPRVVIRPPCAGEATAGPGHLRRCRGPGR